MTLYPHSRTLGVSFCHGGVTQVTGLCEKSATRIVNLPIKRSFERDQPTTLCCALTMLRFWGGGLGEGGSWGGEGGEVGEGGGGGGG